MKKILLGIILFSCGVLQAQTEQKGIELPDFVITGRQSVEVQSAIKKKPELIPLLTKDFFTPQYSPEELPLLVSSVPVKSVPSITAEGNYYSGNLYVGAGKYSLPVGKLFVGMQMENFLISANAWGSDIKNYLPNSGFNSSGVSLSNNLFINTDSDILPGTILRLTGNYERSKFNFFGSAIPTNERKITDGNLAFSIENNYDRTFNFKTEINANWFDMPNTNFIEKRLSAAGIFSFKLSNVEFGSRGSYQKQMLENNLSGIGSYEYYSIQPFFEISPTNKINVKLGMEYHNNAGATFFSPNGSLEIKIGKGTIFNLEFHPKAESITVLDLVKLNYYMVNNLTDNVFTKSKFNLRSSFHYQFENFFSLSLFGEYINTDNYLYFEDITAIGLFEVMQTSDVKTFCSGIQATIYPDKLGYFNGELKYQSVKDANGKFIPYKPTYSAKITYNYDFYFGLGVKIQYNFASEVYKDLLNLIELEQYHNISVGLSYLVFQNLYLTADFQNILNRSNFVWHQYQSKPFDIVAGVVYRW